MKIRKGFTFWKMLVILVIVGAIAFFFFPVYTRPPHNNARTQCQSNLKQIGLALMQYQSDADEKFPPTSNGDGGWARLIQPYTKSWQLFYCPKVEVIGSQKINYALNSRIAGVSLEKFESPANTFLAFDGQSAAPPDFAVSSLPKSWTQNENSPARRHLDGANYLFADGHVKWLRPDKITMKKPNSNNYTFLVR